MCHVDTKRTPSSELPPISWTQEMGGFFMAGNALYDVGMRLRAAELHDEGHGRAAIAALLGMPEETVNGCAPTGLLVSRFWP